MSTDNSVPALAGTDEELMGWMDDWQSEEAGTKTPVLPSAERDRLKRKARRFGLGLVTLSVVELLFCGGLLVWIVQIALRKQTPEAWALVALCVVSIVLSEVVTLWNRRGTWRPGNDSVLAFAELEELRQRRQLLSATRIVPGFLLFQLALMLPWAWWAFSVRDPYLLEARFHLILAWTVLISALVLAKCAYWAGLCRRRLEELEPLLRDLRGEGDG